MSMGIIIKNNTKKGVLISILKILRYVRAAEPQNRPLCFPDFVQ